MKPSLQVRLSQHLALTPQLQQSIRLLQLSTLELHQEIEQMLEQNPFLEAEDEAGTPFDTARRALGHRTQRAGARARGDRRRSGEAVPEMRAEEFGTTERDDWENGTERDDFDGIRETPASAAGGQGEDDDGDFAGPRRRQRLAAGPPARPDGRHAAEREDRAALEVLIESLDGDGYLADPLEDIAERLAEMLDIDGEEAREELMGRLQCALRWLQSLEPLGVGARSWASA
jgi:RNA polymerase sigma-54 factor